MIGHGVASLDEARTLPTEELRADIIRSAARGQGPTFIAAKLDYLIARAEDDWIRIATKNAEDGLRRQAELEAQVRERLGSVKRLIQRMRHDRARFAVMSGSADVVWAHTVDDWADELEALYMGPAGGASEGEKTEPLQSTGALARPESS